MPTMPTTTTHAKPHPKRAPVSALATRSPMSTKPPMAVSTPKKIWKTFFTARSPEILAELLQPLRHTGKRRVEREHGVVVFAPDRDACLAEEVDRLVGHLVDLVAHRVAVGTGRLHRVERLPRRARVLLGLTEQHAQVRIERVAVVQRGDP